MATPFDGYLEAIGNRITIKDEDRPIYTKDFDVIHDYMFKIMRDWDDDFNMICKGASLFGSYSHNTRISYANEFDVHIKLCFPFKSYIDVEKDEDRPGFVNLNFQSVMEELENVNGYDSLYNLLDDELLDWNNYYLRRSNLQSWIHNIIIDALDENGDRIYGASGTLYKLEYSKRGLAHTIYARGLNSNRNISVDFVPAIMFGQTEWLKVRNKHPFRYKCDQWYAVPKPNCEGPSSTRKYTFMICCPKVEHDLLLGKQNLKVVFRLLKSLRNEYDMPRLKSYFITTAFLWEIERQSRNFWTNSLSVILIHMLNVISDYFLDENLPFFWNEDLNLLDIFSHDEIEDYSEKLCKAYNTLKSYPYQKHLTYARTLDHFEIPEGR